MTTTTPVDRAGHESSPVDRSPASDEEPSLVGHPSRSGDDSSAGTGGGRVARPGGRAATAVLAGGAAVLGLLLTALALAVRGGRQPSAADLRLAGLLDPVFVGPLRGAARALAELGSPWLFAIAVIALAAWARRRGDRRLTVIVAAGPLVAVLLADLVLKPVLDRRLGTGFSFPSGHVTAVASLAAAAVVAAHWHRLRHMASVVVGATLAAVAVAVAVVVLDWHAATDALGGLLLGPAVVLGVAAAVLAVVPEPRTARFVRPRYAFFGTVAVLGVSGLVRVPLVELSPGPTIALNEAVSVAAASEAGPLNGDYRGLSVRETSLTAFGWGWHQLSGSENDVLFRSAIIPPGTDADTYYAQQVRVFADAGRIAAFVAESALGYDVTTSGDGAQIVAVEPGSPADGHLVPGDLVTAIGSQPVATDDDLRAAIASSPPGPLDLTVSSPLSAPAGADGTSTDPTAPDAAGAESAGPAGTTGAADAAGTTRPVRHEVVTPAVLASTGRTGLGVVVATAGMRVNLPVEVTVDAGKIGGPSAGLLTGLTVYDRLSSADLAAGRTIAGTGTLDLDGNVGPIGGIEEKTRAAIAAGADLFLAPADQADDAREEADGRVEVIGVRTFSEALAVLGGPLDAG